MDKITVVFDGKVLHPETVIGLEPHKRYVVTIEEEPRMTDETKTAWDILNALKGTIEAPQDWASEHDHYLYGTPKHPDEALGDGQE